MLEQAFDGDGWHSLLANLRSIPPESWTWRPDDGRRSIRCIVGHVGNCKLMYENHASGDATLRWKNLEGEERASLATQESAVVWLYEP